MIKEMTLDEITQDNEDKKSKRLETISRYSALCDSHYQSYKNYNVLNKISYTYLAANVISTVDYLENELSPNILHGIAKGVNYINGGVESLFETMTSVHVPELASKFIALAVGVGAGLLTGKIASKKYEESTAFSYGQTIEHMHITDEAKKLEEIKQEFKESGKKTMQIEISDPIEPTKPYAHRLRS